MSLSGILRRSVSKSPVPPGADEEGFDRAAYERRRQQVRRAQRNHRERKANYVKALEQEVVNLRKQNQQNIREYEDEVRMLHGIFLSHGITPPPRQARIINPTTLDIDAHSPSSFTVTKPPGLAHPLHLNIPEGLGRDPSGGVATRTGDAESPHSGPSSARRPSSLAPLAIPNTLGRNPITGGTPMTEQLSPGSIDKVHGINFVLSIEHPCMNHPDMTRDEFGTHSHMATHNLLAYAPSDVSSTTNWEVPGVSIERLLELSTNFHLEGELTPVQAWFSLKQHPLFSTMSEGQLHQLKTLLLPEAKCYGFGAVVDQEIWQIAIQSVLTPASAS